MESITIAILMILGSGVGICLGIILGEREHRKATLQEMNDERLVLREALKQISDTHNNLVGTQRMQGEALEDLGQRVSFLVQGVKK
jgi:hypothetical protein